MSLLVDEATLDAIRAERARRDAAAHALGVALAEYELAKNDLRKVDESMTLDERYLRLGAVQHEFEGYKDSGMKVIARSLAMEKRIADGALAAFGLPQEGRTFTIDQKTGDVLELVAGAYVPVEDAP